MMPKDLNKIDIYYYQMESYLCIAKYGTEEIGIEHSWRVNQRLYTFRKAFRKKYDNWSNPNA